MTLVLLMHTKQIQYANYKVMKAHRFSVTLLLKYIYVVGWINWFRWLSKNKKWELIKWWYYCQKSKVSNECASVAFWNNLFFELSLKVFWVTNHPTKLDKHNYEKTLIKLKLWSKSCELKLFCKLDEVANEAG